MCLHKIFGTYALTKGQRVKSKGFEAFTILPFPSYLLHCLFLKKILLRIYHCSDVSAVISKKESAI